MSGEWIEGLPGWHENLKMVEVEWEDGRRLTGRLNYDDTTAGPEEWPLYYIETARGEKISIADSDRYRLIPASAA